VYLIAFFGVSAVVALITLLVIGYRVFEFLLGDVTGGSLLDRIRAPFGLLVGAALVAGYHFALWRHDRALLAAAQPARKRTIEQLTQVLGQHADPEAVARGIAEATGGARVTVWLRADDGGPALPAAGADSVGAASQAPAETVGQVAAALDGVTAQHVLVLVGHGTLEVIPLHSPPK
jgi:hypothetical protein